MKTLPFVWFQVGFGIWYGLFSNFQFLVLSSVCVFAVAFLFCFSVSHFFLHGDALMVELPQR